ncbi:MAG: hypothetical protein FWD31_08900 [Planctomycetaceae bacterium]|nr:hypothetical protein [Planctomycetaceae bacterium]
MDRFIEFSKLLGWNDVQLFQHHGNDADAGIPTITWYSEGEFDESLYFQLNIMGGVRIAVYYMKYEIFTGWHKVDSEDLTSEAKRLAPLFSKTNFADDHIMLFKERFPQYTGFYWKDGGGIAQKGNDKRREFVSWVSEEDEIPNSDPAFKTPG